MSKPAIDERITTSDQTICTHSCATALAEMQ